ncbi:hypothetical protein ACQP2K_29735 [Microbispora siamensis]
MCSAPGARANKLDRARDDLHRLERGLGSRHYPTTAKVAARIAVIARDRRVAAYLRTEAGTDPATGKPTLVWHFDQNAIDAEAAGDGALAGIRIISGTGQSPPIIPQPTDLQIRLLDLLEVDPRNLR